MQEWEGGEDVAVGAEVAISILGLALATRLAVSVAHDMLPHSTAVRRGRRVAPLLAGAALASALGLLLVLATLSSSDVRSDLGWAILYEVIGVVWMIGSVGLVARTIGIAVGQDVIDRRNLAAALVIAGAMMATTLAFAGANVGDGPGLLIVLACALLSTGGLFALWVASDRLGRSTEVVLLDRDVATGLRVPAWLVSVGLVLGRAVAGDWESSTGTLRDFVAVGWPAILLAAIETVVARRFRPTAERPVLSVRRHGVIPGAGYALVAAAWVVAHGWP